MAVPASSPIVQLSTTEIERGHKYFKQYCARCHGMEARGGTGPSLRRPVLQRAARDEDLFSVIRYGIPGTEMPGTWLLSEKDIWQVAAYIRSIAQPAEDIPAGNADNGKRIFESKGACRNCHIVHGRGVSLGPELSQIGAKRGISYLQNVLLQPGFYRSEEELSAGSGGNAQYLLMSVVTKAGEEIQGIRINEDAFTLQLKDAQNQFYSLRKKDLIEIRKEFGRSLMPSVKEILSAGEIDDLVAYLVSLK